MAYLDERAALAAEISALGRGIRTRTRQFVASVRRAEPIEKVVRLAVYRAVHEMLWTRDRTRAEIDLPVHCGRRALCGIASQAQGAWSEIIETERGAALVTPRHAPVQIIRSGEDCKRPCAAAVKPAPVIAHPALSNV